jgi:hypothetical protein
LKKDILPIPNMFLKGDLAKIEEETLIEEVVLRGERERRGS